MPVTRASATPASTVPVDAPRVPVQPHAAGPATAGRRRPPPRLNPGAVTGLQRQAGNRAVADHLAVQRQAAEAAADPAPAPTPAPPNVDWIENLDDHIKQQIDTFAPATFDEATGSKRDELATTRRENRETFVTNMVPFLGSEAAVQAHFEAIKPMEGTDLWAHASVRERLAEVKADLESRGTPMPATTVGLGLRGRHLHPQGVGMMMHPLGFAVDWKAFAAPHVTDRRLHTLFATATGGPPAFHLSVGGQRLTSRARLDLIEQMGKGTADPDRAAQLLTSVEAEYIRLSKASSDFKASLPETSLAALREVERLRTQISEAEKALKRARRKGKDAVGTAAAALAAARTAFEQKKVEVRGQVETIFAPWLTELDRRAAAVDAAATAKGVDLHTEVTTAEYLDYLGAELTQLSKDARKPEKAARTLLDGIRKTRHEVGLEIAGIEANLTAGSAEREALLAMAQPVLVETGELEAALAALMPDVTAKPGKGKPPKRSVDRWNRVLTGARERLAKHRAGYEAIAAPLGALRAKQGVKRGDLTARQASNAAVAGRVGKAGLAELQQERKRLFWLEETAKALRTDINFVIPPDRSVLDPGVTQLLGLVAGTEGGGFFTPDPETGGEKQAEKGQWSGSHGFNLQFFKSMVSHGFELAVAWEDTPDTMHFELVEGRKFATSGGKDPMTAGAHTH
jgi:hypothetical protein